jgi:murein DD-endopeptidase MepM/ murein hydrolase activator NlpD
MAVAGMELPDMVVNPFQPPRWGSDDPHQGVDLAQRRDGNSPALKGLTVQAILPGTVAAVIDERFPYGNALLVETPMGDLPRPWLEQLHLPTPAPTLASPISLTCPTGVETVEINSDIPGRSLYILYAHLLEPPTLQSGDLVFCGENLGAIGDSGNALNPHLHVEMRIGPSGARFPGMAHYDTSATPDEMANYCLWRVSGLFQLLDPMLLLAQVQ